MPESNQVKWIGIRPTNPEENIPVKQSDPALLKSTVTQASNIREVYPKRKTGTTQIVRGELLSNVDQIIYTVTAGKTFYLTHFTISQRADVTGQMQIRVRDTQDTYVYIIAAGCRLIGGGEITSGTINPPLEIPAGFDICVLCNPAGFYVIFFMVGWEE